ncbi:MULTISPECIES: DUF2178 domain-containing protein [Methanobacterium]|uniref:DUF2178 domain-containing protein n=1 Tax=Methanobacterium bryantii TaxID=2161 RepID=A0A2A2H4W1_METBR|nr:MULTISPECIES: DUF2178 domain-containing protein [Methanobacterium]OEC85621.1 hypothetical protein A9507_13385 [Methanobacterium sp. A39]PAV04334.1 hypothetical protein ASJ80_05670 [Methanobacterium bryantii]
MENYKIVRIIITIFVAMIAGISVELGEIIPAILAIVIGAMVSYIYKKNTNETLEDERIIKISEKASRMAMVLFSITIAIIGLFFITMRNQYPNFIQAGYTLAYSAVALLGLYYVFYGYYNKKYGY